MGPVFSISHSVIFFHQHIGIYPSETDSCEIVFVVLSRGKSIRMDNIIIFTRLFELERKLNNSFFVYQKFSIFFFSLYAFVSIETQILFK